MKISKSKQELARIISENGGWVKGNYAVQDKDDKCIWFMLKLEGRPQGRAAWPGSKSNRISCDRVMPNWHQTILSRAEYFRLYPAPDADGWIEWNGGECPVGDDALVEIKTRDGEIQIDQAYYWNWSHERGSPVQDRQIIAYRLHNQDQVEHEFCESVMRSIPEPSDKPTIEKLASDYRNLKDFADRKQQEADTARGEADAALDRLYQAGLDIGLDIAIASDECESESELVITDWRDLLVGDEISVQHMKNVYSKSEVMAVCNGEVSIRNHAGARKTVNLDDVDWKFIRRP